MHVAVYIFGFGLSNYRHKTVALEQW